MSWPKPPVSMQSKTQEHGPVPMDYVGKHKAMSSKTVVVDLLWQGKRQFAFTVNEHVFNPIDSIVGHKLVDLVLSEKIQVADKNVIDLGVAAESWVCAPLRRRRKKSSSPTSTLTSRAYKNIHYFERVTSGKFRMCWRMCLTPATTRS